MDAVKGCDVLANLRGCAFYALLDVIKVFAPWSASPSTTDMIDFSDLSSAAKARIG